MSGLQGAAVIKRKHSVGADNGGPQSGQNPRVRFQVEERPEKRRLVIPDDFTLVRQSCVVNPGAVASGQQELWLIQLPNLAALQNLAATGSIEVDSSILRSVGLSSASIGSLPSFQCHDGLSYKLVPEVNTVAKQLITICPMENEEGEAQAISVSRRLTLVRDLVPPETGSTAGEPEDVQAALARLDASLAAMGVARREVAAANATEGAMEVDDGRGDVGASAPAGGVDRSGGKKPSNKDLQKEERSGKRSGKEGEGVETTHKEKHKDKSKEKDKKKDKDKDKHEKSKLAQTPGVVPALKGTGIKQPPATAPPAMRPPAAAETPATALTAVEATPAGAASTGKKDKHKDKKHKDKDKRDKDKKHKDKDKKKKDKKKKDKKEKDKDKKGVKKDSSSETDSDSD